MSSILDRQSDAQERAAKRFGISTIDQLRKSPMKYRWDVIEHDALKLLEARTDLPTGRAGTARNDFISYMAGLYLSCAFVEKVPIPEPVLHLACRQLKTKSFAIKSDESSELIDEACRLIADNPKISDRVLATRVVRSPKTIRRWRAKGLIPRRTQGAQ